MTIAVAAKTRINVMGWRNLLGFNCARLMYISTMSRNLTVAAMMVVGVVIAVFVLGKKSQRRPNAGDANSVTAEVTRQSRHAAPERTPPPGCAPLTEGGFSCGACLDDTSCPAGKSCFVNMETGRTECQGSECEKKEDCPRGTLCRVVARNTRGEPLRGCVTPGLRPAGAACDPDNAGDPAVSCSGQLLCVQGGCAPSCVENEFPERNACVGEAPCVKTDDGWGCVPSCKYEPKDSCRDGKVCEFLSVEDQTALCIHKVGANCLGSKGGCPYDHDCLVETNARAERTSFTCAMRCDPSNPTCPADSVCVPGQKKGHCRHRCTPTDSAPCGEGERCKRAEAAGSAWYCSAA